MQGLQKLPMVEPALLKVDHVQWKDINQLVTQRFLFHLCGTPFLQLAMLIQS